MKYVSCSSLEKNIVFDLNNFIRICTLSVPKIGGSPALIHNYNGELIDWDNFFIVRNQQRELMKQGGCLRECKGCAQISEGEWDNKNEIEYILLTPWVNCNLACIYCRSHQISNRKDYNILPVLKDMIDKGILSKSAKIDFAGGEPTIYPYFEETINLFVERGYTDIIVHTNAVRFSPYLADAIKKGAVNIRVSLDCYTRNTYKKIKSFDYFNDVVKNLKIYTKCQPNGTNNLIHTKYILVPGVNDNEKEMFGWLKLSKNIGIKYVSLNIDFNWVNKNSDCKNVKTLEHIFELAEKFVKRATELNLNFQLFPNLYELYQRFIKIHPEKIKNLLFKGCYSDT